MTLQRLILIVNVDGSDWYIGWYPTMIKAQAAVAAFKVEYPTLKRWRIEPLIGIRELKKLAATREKALPEKQSVSHLR